MSADVDGGFCLTAVGQVIIKEDVTLYRDPDFLAVLATTRASDVCFTSLEGTISGRHGGWPMKPPTLTHASDPLVLDCLKAMGFNLLSLVNNHACDLGPGGVLSAIEEAQARGLAYAGIGPDLKTAAQPGICIAKGRRVALVAMDAGPQESHVYATDASDRAAARPGCNRLQLHSTIVVQEQDLAMLRTASEKLNHEIRKEADRKASYRQTPGTGFEFYGLRFQAGTAYEELRIPDAADVERNLAAVEDAAGNADVVIAYVHHHHWEPRWEIPPRWLRAFARSCVDRGANMVLSHGVPMLQGAEIYKRAPLFYGLGNFIFHTWQPRRYEDERIWQSVVARMIFNGSGVERIELSPVVMGGQQALESQSYDSRRVPHLARGAYGTRILQRFANMSKQFGTNVQIDGDKAVIDVAA